MDGWEFQLCKITPFGHLLSLCVSVCARVRARSGGGGGGYSSVVTERRTRD